MVLIMQFFWLYIDDFVGKGLDVGTIFEFIWYQSAVLVPLALPLAVLLSSLMTFGNLGESFELVAIKSAGISLFRFMRPLFILTILICGIAFLFSNYVIPFATLKQRTLLTDIVRSKPAFDLREGVFYDKIPQFSIKVGKKENDSIIRDVIIYENGSDALQDNFIVAKSGVMRVTPDRRFLELNLYDGWRYQERGSRLSTNTEFVRLGFSEYKKQMDLSAFMFKRTDDSVNKNNEKMLSMRQLDRSLDSIHKQITGFDKRIQDEVYSNFAFVRYLDSSGWDKNYSLPDSVSNFKGLLPDSISRMMNYGAPYSLNSARNNYDILMSEYNARQKELRKHEIEWHRKITLSVACLVLFLIGAPLGSIIRKGGLGTPLIFAIIFFMLFYFTSTTGEKFAKEGSMSSMAGMWLSTMILLPVGLFLCYKALRDSTLFNKEFYFRFYNTVRKYLAKKKKQDIAKS